MCRCALLALTGLAVLSFGGGAGEEHAAVLGHQQRVGAVVAHRELDYLWGLGDGQLHPLPSRGPALLDAQTLVLARVVDLPHERQTDRQTDRHGANEEPDLGSSEQ